MHPITSKCTLLPFEGHGFTWSTFEEFFCDFLSAGPKLAMPDGTNKKVLKARPYGRRGDRQDGIDIEATMEDGAIWAFQCKHYPKASFGPKKAEKAIEDCTFQADRKFILITREISEECREAVAKFDDWEIWGPRDISREFINRMPDRVEAARILNVHFGPGWPEQFFDIPGSSPLRGPEGNFSGFLSSDRRFHHRTELVGRIKWLNRLNDFVGSSRAICLLLKGRGGIGKSRLLLEWSRQVCTEYPDTTVRFISDGTASTSDYARAIDLSPKPLILVVDDAHRLKEVRRALFPIVVQRDQVKLLLSLRPGPTTQIRAELAEAGLDTSQIVEPPELKQLPAADNRKLVEAALGDNLTPQLRRFVAEHSRDSPLIAVLAVSLIREGELDSQEIQDTDDFRDHVLGKGFEKDITRARTALGLTRTTVEKFTQLIAMLAPVRIDDIFRERAAELLGGDSTPDVLFDLAESLRDAGVLQESTVGDRIVPDLLSDHLAYTACYDKSGRERPFARRVFEEFAEDGFQQILPHLALAEWRAGRKHDSAASVIAPLWRWLTDKLEGADPTQTIGLIDLWKNVAHLQPARTLQLARKILSETQKTGETEVIGAMAGLLKPVANSWPKHVGPCLDILWDIGKDHLDGDINWHNSRHPLTVIGEIGGFEVWKSIKVSEAVMDWLETRFSDATSFDAKNAPWKIVLELLKPFFKTDMEENWSSGDSIHFRAYLVSIPKTRNIRERALGMCSRVAAWDRAGLTLGVVDVLDRALANASLRFSGKISSAYRRQWQQERSKALTVLRAIIQSNTHPVILFKSRKLILHHLRYGNPSEFRNELRFTLESIPDSLGLRLIRCTLSHYHEEYDRPPGRASTTDWHDEMEKRWKSFISDVGAEFRNQVRTPSGLITRIGELDVELGSLGFNPNWRPLLYSMAESDSEYGVKIAEAAISQKGESIGIHLDAVIYAATKGDDATRSDLCSQAIDTCVPELVVGAIECFMWWRKDAGELPESVWASLLSSASYDSTCVSNAVIQFVRTNCKRMESRDWLLLLGLPSVVAVGQGSQLLQLIADLLEQGASQPQSEWIVQLLSKLESIERFRHRDGRYFAQIAAIFPAEVFLFFWQRVQRSKIQSGSAIQPLPFEIESISFKQILDSPATAAIVREVESRVFQGGKLDYCEQHLMAGLLLHRESGCEERFRALVEKVSSSDQLDSIQELIATSVSHSVVLAAPNLVRTVLLKARSFGDETHEKTVDELIHLKGVRSGSNDGPDQEWKELLATVERLAHKYSSDPELGPFYSRIAEHERAWMEGMKRDFAVRHSITEEE